MLDPKNASVVFTPLDARNHSHPTVGRLLIIETENVARCLDPKPEPLNHSVFARPVQSSTFTEAMQVVPDGDDDPSRAMLATFARLVLRDGLATEAVGAMFSAHLAGWSQLLADGRLRGRQRLALR